MGSSDVVRGEEKSEKERERGRDECGGFAVYNLHIHNLTLVL